MQKTILEARVFVSDAPTAHERIVKDYEIDVECTDGREYTYNGETHRLNSGDVLFRSPGGTVSSCGKQKSYLLTLDFTAAPPPHVYSRNIAGPLQKLTDDPLITSLPAVLHPRNPYALSEIYERLIHTPQLCSREAELLVDELIFLLNAERTHKAYLQQKTTNDVIDKVIRFMESNLSRKITLEELAAVSNFEKSYFIRVFKKVTGTTPLKMLNGMRLERAGDLVVATDIKIQDIAADFGYNTLSFFIAEYKKRFGLTPAAHRKNSLDLKK